MKKSGFTLAEVLITLGIIGVVAALTAPALVQNAGSAQIGPKLAKAVSTFELANQNMLNAADAATIKASGATSGNGTAEENYLNNLSNYMKANLQTETDGNKYADMLTDYNGDALTSPNGYDKWLEQNRIDLDKIEVTPSWGEALQGALFGTAAVAAPYNQQLQNLVQQQIALRLMGLKPQTAVQTIALGKDGMLFAVDIDANVEGRIGNQQTIAHKIGYGTVVIDINGKAEPNKMGRDAFLFQLQADGSLIPYGSNGEWDTGDDKCNATEVTTGYTCGASIYENNLKVIYQ